jgi:site-specific DNA-cytosine methylase
MNVLSLFDGISTGRLALETAGIDVASYYASEIDRDCILVSQRRYPDIIHLGDILKLPVESLPSIDLLLAGSPCQGFSAAGNRMNFEDPRSVLFFEFVRMLNLLKPKYFLLENTRMKKEHQDYISELLGVQPLRIDSSLVSAQSRWRVYWTNIPNVTIPLDRNIMLRDIIGSYDGINVYPRGRNRGGLMSYNGKCPTITSSSWPTNFHIVKKGVKRAFSAEECERIQTLPEGYTQGASYTKRIKMIGNGWTTDVIAHIISFLNDSKNIQPHKPS